MMKVKNIELSLISAKPSQPRLFFDEDSIEELAHSIKANGLIQPIVVRPVKKGFEVIAGERRLRAFQMLGEERIPAIVIEATDDESENLSLIENIQRMDLSPIEEAIAYQSLLANQKITQDQLARKIGKSQSSIANKLRLLSLSAKVKAAIGDMRITERHGRSLVGLDIEIQDELLEKILKGNLNVTQTEKLTENLGIKKPSSRRNVVARGTHVLLGINTINDAVKSIKNLGIKIQSEESEDDDYYSIIIKIKK